MAQLLQIRSLTKYFGGLVAVDRVDFDVTQGEIVGLIGPNGAGKTTIFNLITGFFPSDKGHVLFRGEDITNLKPHIITAKGLARTFQGGRVFYNISVKENIYWARYVRTRAGIFDCLTRSRLFRKEKVENDEKVSELLKLVGLETMENVLTHNLPYAYLNLLGIAIALATEPSFLILDEPFAGMNYKEMIETTEFIRKIQQRGITILVTEHNMKAIMNVCHRIVVLDYGRKIAEGSPTQIVENKNVIEAYLGKPSG